jgi:caffeoyl-CoA O-methyltransferase
VADNVISHQVELQPMIDAALVDPRVDAVVVPIGKGELVCRKR